MVAFVAVSSTGNNTVIGFVDVGCLRLSQSFGTREHSMKGCQIEMTEPRLPHFGDVQDMTELYCRNVRPQKVIEEGCTS